jgi:hypothetical protein
MPETAKPNYHHAPYTLDANRDLPENVEEQPLSAGHDEEQRDRVRAADDEHTEAVRETEQAEAQRAEEQADEPAPTPSEFEASQQAAPPEEKSKSSKSSEKAKKS